MARPAARNRSRRDRMPGDNRPSHSKFTLHDFGKGQRCISKVATIRQIMVAESGAYSFRTATSVAGVSVMLSGTRVGSSWGNRLARHRACQPVNAIETCEICAERSTPNIMGVGSTNMRVEKCRHAKTIRGKIDTFSSCKVDDLCAWLASASRHYSNVSSENALPPGAPETRPMTMAMSSATLGTKRLSVSVDRTWNGAL